MTERSHEKAAGSAVEEGAIDTLPDNAVLLMIDVQQSFDSPHLGHGNNPRRRITAPGQRSTRW